MNKAECKCRRGRPKAMSDDQRRALILAHAERLFLDKGYGGASTDEIASCCRMSKQTLYRLFPGKLDLFAAVLESKQLRMINLTDDQYDDLPLDEALGRVFMVDLDQESYEKRATFLRITQTEASVYPELCEVLQRRGAERTRSELERWLERQRQLRGLRIKGVRSAVHMLMDMFIGAVVFDAIGGFGWTTAEERIKHFRQCIDIVLHGIAPVDTVC